MANTELLPMNPDFARWLTAIGLGDQEAQRQARWAGINTVVQNAGMRDIEALIRLAFKTRQEASVAEVQKVRQAFQAADATFEMQGNDRELQILAASSLAALMSTGSKFCAEAALAVATATLDGARKPTLPMDLHLLAETAIYHIAEANRERPNLSSHVLTETPKFDFEKAALKAKENTWEAVAQGFTLAAEETRKALVKMVRRQADAVSAIDRFLQLQDEELQMLWWLIGERSFEIDRRFDAIAVEIQPLLFAKELADFTRLLPGPLSINALLSRAGLRERKKIGVSHTINASDPAWLKTFVAEEDYSPVTAPLHFGIKRQLETGAGDTWVAGWAAATGAPADLAMAPLTLGLQFYRERLLSLFGDGVRV